VEFLVEIDVQWPADGNRQQRDALVQAESQRSAELAAAGILKRVWRIPGRWANVSLWEAADATALHEAIASLPFYPWLKVTVRPLAAHPNDPARR
jgi:muconolactone D-isomerase